MTKVYDTATDIITFARSSSGTALRRVGYGPELVVDGSGNWVGDFDVAADASEWGDVGVWDAGSISWNASGYADVTDVGYEGVAQVISGLTVGATYFISVDVVDVPTDTGRLYVGSANNPGTSTVLNQNGLGLGTHVFYFKATATSHAVGLSSTSGGATVGWDNISVKEVIFDRPSDDLVLFDHPDDIPRIEYAADGSLKGLLIEEQRTNLFSHSEDFSQSYWTKETGVSIDSTLVTGPDGTLSGRRVLGFGSASGVRLSSTVNITNSTLSSSIWVKGEGSDIGKDIRLATRGDGGTFVGSNIDHTLTADWVRIDVSFTQFADNTGVFFSLRRPDTNPASEVLIYGAQLEQGSFPTSYIPTSGGQKTRDPDIASIPVSAFGYNQDAGSVVVEASFNGFTPNGPTGYPRVWHLDQASNKYLALMSNAAKNVNYRDDEWGGEVTALTATEGVAFRAAVAFSDGDAAVSGNGGVASTASPVSTLDMPSDLSLGNATGDRFLNGHIKSLSYFPRRLTDAQLQELTS